MLFLITGNADTHFSVDKQNNETFTELRATSEGFPQVSHCCNAVTWLACGFYLLQAIISKQVNSRHTPANLEFFNSFLYSGWRRTFIFFYFLPICKGSQWNTWCVTRALHSACYYRNKKQVNTLRLCVALISKRHFFHLCG